MIAIPRSPRAVWRLAIVALLFLALCIGAGLEMSGRHQALTSYLGVRSTGWSWLSIGVHLATAVALIVRRTRTPSVLIAAAFLVCPLMYEFLSASPTVAAALICALAAGVCFQLDRREKEIVWMRQVF